MACAGDEKIIDQRPFAVVMTSYNGATIQSDVLTSSLMPVDQVRSGTRSTLQKLTRASILVVVLRDSPLPPFNVPACLGRAIAQAHPATDICAFDAAQALNASAFEAERAAAAGLPNVVYLDMDDLICPGKSCPAVQRGRSSTATITISRDLTQSRSPARWRCAYRTSSMRRWRSLTSQAARESAATKISSARPPWNCAG